MLVRSGTLMTMDLPDLEQTIFGHEAFPQDGGIEGTITDVL